MKRREGINRGVVEKTESARGVRFVPNAKEAGDPNDGIILYIPGHGETARGKGAFVRPLQEYARISGEEIWCAEDPAIEDELSEETIISVLEERRAYARAYYKHMVDNEILEQALAEVPLHQFQKAYNAILFIEEESAREGTIPPHIDRGVFHSQGTVVGTLCLLFWPEYFKGAHVVFSNPVGGWNPSLEGDKEHKALVVSEKVKESRMPPLARLFKDPKMRANLVVFSTALVKTLLKGNIQAALDYAKYALTGPKTFLRRLDEGTELMDFDAKPALVVLAASGIRITAVTGEKDNLSTKEDVETTLKKVSELIHGMPGSIEGERLDGGHYEIVEEPERFAQYIQKIFTQGK